MNIALKRDQILRVLEAGPLQKAMLVLAQRAADDGAVDPYIVQTWGKIAGLRDAASLTEAIQKLTARHDALRSAFVHQGQSEPRQVILRDAVMDVSVHDWTECMPRDIDQRLYAFRTEDRAKGFDLRRPPLMRLALFRTSGDEWRFLLTHHHVILDGWAQNIVFADLLTLVEAIETDQPLDLPDPVGLVGHARSRPDPAIDADSAWARMLADWAPTALPEPMLGERTLDHARPTTQIPASTVRRVLSLARQLDVTQGEIAVSAWLLTLARVTGQHSITSGVTTSGRSEDASSLHAVGMFSNTLPLTIACAPQRSLAEYVRTVRDRMRMIVASSYRDPATLHALAGATAENPLFDTLIAFENFPAMDVAPSGVRFSDLQSEERTNLPAALVVVPGEDGWTVSVQADLSAITSSMATCLVDCYTRILGELVTFDPEMSIGALLDADALTTSDLRAPLKSVPDRWSTLIDAWAESLNGNRERPAIRFDGDNITYGELDERSRRVAAALIERGIVPGDRVAVWMGRTPDLIAVLLGIVRAGACYVPIEVNQPSERVRFVLQDADTVLVITDASDDCKGAVPASSLLTHAQKLATDLEVPPEMPLYVIYTSGSTGRPKGVIVTHENVVALIDAGRDLFDLRSTDVWSFFHSIAFDFSVWEIWGALLTGGSVLVVPFETTRDPSAFGTLCKAQGVSVLSQTPSAFRAFVQARETDVFGCDALRYVVFGGEALPTATLKQWLAQTGTDKPRLINMFGITETTVHVTFSDVLADDVLEKVLAPLGEPMPHMALDLLDPDMRPAHPETPGEIAVSGQSVAAGYLGRPRLTAERFVPDAHAERPGARTYLSGDLGVRRSRGDLHPLGRIDRQIKLRGFRIEPGEIEKAAESLDGITTAVASTARRSKTGDEGQNIGLVLWFVPDSDTDRDGLVPRLVDHLSTQLQSHMVPERFVAVSQIPLTTNGKTDFAALPNPYNDLAADRAVGSDGTGTDPVIRAICAAWAEALEIKTVLPDDNYFSIGGDSIRSLRIKSVAARHGLDFGIGDLLANPTPRMLAVHTSLHEEPIVPTKASVPFATLTAAERAELPEDATDAWPATRLQTGMLFQSEFADGNKQYVDIFSYRLKPGSDTMGLDRAIDAILLRHPVLRSRFVQTPERLLQVVPEAGKARLSTHDLRGHAEARQEELLDRIFASLGATRIDGFGSDLFRITACRLTDDEWFMSFLFHHAILDGWSFSLVCAELFDIWSGRTDPKSLPPAHNHQPQHSEAERHALLDDALIQRWTARLKNIQPRIWSWPETSDASEPRQSRVPVPDIDSVTLRALHGGAQSKGLPLKAWLLAATAQVLATLEGLAEITIGTITNCRPSIDSADSSVGMFLNTVPLTLSRRPTWLEMVEDAQNADVAVWNDRMIPLAEMARIAGRTPYAATFNFVNFRASEAVSNRVTPDPARSIEETEIDLSITFSLSPDGSSLVGEIKHGNGIGTRQANVIANALGAALRAMADAPRTAPAIPLPAPAIPAIQPMDAFEPVHVTAIRRLAERPNAWAINDLGRGLTSNADLLAETGRIAGGLARLGPLAGRPVALAIDKSSTSVAAHLAVLALGGWTVAIDKNAPAARIRMILEDLIDPLVLVDNEPGPELGGLEGLIDLSALPTIPPGDVVECSNRLCSLLPAHPDARAYGIFTSGSTGRPKGVVVHHSALAAQIGWFVREFDLTPIDRVLYRTRPSFDASIWELWAPLLSGAELTIPRSGDSGDPDALVRIVQESSITMLQIVPSLLEVMTDAKSVQALNILRILFVGGEVLRRDQVMSMQDVRTFDLVNLYGPTETTVQSAFARFDAGCPLPAIDVLDVGRPVDGTTAAIVDPDLRRRPAGAVGELVIGGLSVAQGYLGQPGLTAARFVPDPDGPPGARVFRTGDMARHPTDGSITVLGRSDQQIKIGGNRVELGEIEAAMGTILVDHRSAVTFEQDGGVARLVAHVEETSDGPAAFLDHLRQGLVAALPPYMMPSVYRKVATWPLLSNGKTDRLGLMAAGQPWDEPTGRVATPLAAEDPKTAAISKVFAKLFDRPVGPDEDFFALGGDSILAMQLVANARRLDMELTPRDVFDGRTINGIVDRCTPRQGPAPAAAKVAVPNQRAPEMAASGPVPLLPAQAWFLSRELANPDWWNHVVTLKLAKPAPHFEISDVLHDLGKRHSALGLRFGPDGATQSNTDPMILIAPIKQDHPDEAAFKDAISTLQSRLNLAQGPIWGAALRTETGQVQSLAVAIHHMAVDGVSWRTLFEDLDNLLAGRDLPPPPPSIAMIADTADRPVAPESRLHWLDYAAQALTISAPDPLSQTSATLKMSFTLTAEVTERLLAQGGTRSNIERILGATLLVGLHETGRADPVTIAVERHGRKDDMPPRANETVGWFTEMFPCIAEPKADLDAALRTIDDALATIGSLGTDWLAARLAVPGVSNVPDPMIVLNYLGSFGSSFGTDKTIAPLEGVAFEPIDPQNQRLNALEVVGLTQDGALSVSLSADRAFLMPWDLATLSETMQALLAQISFFDGEAVADDAETDAAAPTIGMPEEFEALTASIPGLTAVLPASPSQEGMYITNALQDGASEGIYVQQIVLRLATKASVPEIRQRFQRLVQRHDALRTAFRVTEEGETVQTVIQDATLPIRFIDLSDAKDAAWEWASVVQQDAAIGYELNEAPLSRVVVARTVAGEMMMLWSHHHAILDGWSIPILLHELGLGDEGWSALDTPAQPDAYWQRLRETRQPNALARRRTEWKRRFECFEAPARLSDAVGGTPSVDAQSLRLKIDAAAYDRLTRLAAANGLTLSTLVQAAFAFVLGTACRRRDLAIGVVISGRPSDIEHSQDWVGNFINTLPLRVQIDHTAPVLDWLRTVQEGVLDLNANATDRLADVQSWIGHDRLFDAIVIFQNYPLRGAREQISEGIQVTDIEIREINEYPLSMYVERDEALSLTLKSRPGALSEQCFRSIGHAIVDVLRSWTDDPGTPLGNTQMSSGAATVGAVGRETVPVSVEAAVFANAQGAPGKPAVVSNDGDVLSYSDLVRVATAMAQRIRSNGCGADDIVAIVDYSSPMLLSAMLATQIAGCAFLAVDPDLPRDRIAAMLTDAKPSLCIVPHHDAATSCETLGITAWAIDNDAMARLVSSDPVSAFAPVAPDPQALAYVVFTSGSTGRPKAVQISRRAFSNAVGSFARSPGITASDHFGAVTTPAFDIALLELFAPLAAGATVHLFDRATVRDGRALSLALQTRAITVMQATPATWKLLAAAGYTNGDLRAWCGGEALRRDLAADMATRFAEVWNLYGPTETTIWSSCARISGDAVNVGRPANNTGLWILDDRGYRVLPGFVGELAISGMGVARGYLGQAAKTANVFVPEPGGDGQLMYRTGDLAAFDANGELLIFGRIDRQIKSNGFRVEPGEIEATIRRVSGLQDTVVARTDPADPDSGLAAWLVVPEANNFDEKTLREKLASLLPAYMCPAHIIPIQSVPLNPNGKVDITALPSPLAHTPQVDPPTREHDAFTLLTAVLARLVLKVSEFGPTDDFFKSGGHSLQAMQLRARLEKVVGQEIPLTLIFEEATPACIAQRVLHGSDNADAVNTRAAQILAKAG